MFDWGFFITGACVLIVVALLVTLGQRVAQASKSEINVEMDCVRGKGFVGAIGAGVFDVGKAPTFSNFHLTYDQIATVTANGDWLTFVAAGSQYAVKTPNAASLAPEIQENIKSQKA